MKGLTRKWSVVVLAMALCQGASVAPGEDKETDRVVSPDGQHVAQVVERNSQQWVVVDGIEGKKYKGMIDVSSLCFSPDSQHLTYKVARQDNHWLMVVDGVAYQVPDLVLSPDGKRTAYLLLRGNNKWRVVADGVPGKEYDGINRWRIIARVPLVGFDSVTYDKVPGESLLFSPDGQRLAYVAQQGGKWRFVVDGAEQKKYGRRFLWRADHEWVVVDGAEQKNYDQIEVGSLRFSPDSQRLAYVAQQGAKMRVVVDSVAGTEYDKVPGESLLFSPDSQRLAYAAQRGKKWRVVVDGVEGKEYDGIGRGTLSFGADSQQVRYDAKRGDQVVSVVNGVEEQETPWKEWRKSRPRLWMWR